MPLFFHIGGVDIGVTRVRLGEVPGFVSAADHGVISEGSYTIEDPSASLTVTGWQSAYVAESLATAYPRIYSGWVEHRILRRNKDHALITGVAREWDVRLVDLNALFYFKVIHLKEAKRPQETDVARMQWILGSQWLSGLIADHGLVSTANPVTLDEADYRGQYPGDVLNDCVAARFGKNFFATWNQASGEPELFYDTSTAATFSSTLRISNVKTDIDETTTFYALDGGAELEKDPTGVYSRVYLIYTGGSIRRELASTATTFGITRDLSVRNDRIGRLATAESIAAQTLARHAAEEDLIKCTVRLPAAKVNDIREGMRVQVKFSEFTDYATFTYVRVLRRTVKQVERSDQFYDVDLELVGNGSASAGGGPGGGGGGGGGGGPYVPPAATDCASLIVQQGTVGSTSVLPSTPTVGNTLVFLIGWRAGGNESLMVGAGWTLVRSANTSEHADCASPAPAACIMTRVVQSGDGTSWLAGSLNGHGRVIELSGTPAVIDTDARSCIPYDGNTNYGGSVALGSSSALVLAISGFSVFDVLPGVTITPDAGWTTLIDEHHPTGGPYVSALYKSGTGTILPHAIALAAHSGQPDEPVHGGVTVAFECGTADSAPGPGQQVIEEFTPDCTTTVFTLDNPYLENSLDVSVVDAEGHAVNITAEQTDPFQGVFTLSPAPCTTVQSQMIPLLAKDPVDSRYYNVTDPTGNPIMVRTVTSTSTGGRIVVRYLAGAGPATGGTNPPPTPAPPPSQLPPAVPPSVTHTYPYAPDTTYDQSEQIRAWIAATASAGRVLGFTPGTYRVDRMYLENTANVTIAGDNVIWRRVVDTDYAITQWDTCAGLTIYNLTVEGIATLAGIQAATDFAGEGKHCFDLRGVHTGLLSGVTGRRTTGDGVEYSRVTGGAAATRCTGVRITGSTFHTLGRNGISHISGSTMEIDHNTITNVGLHGFDAEPDESADVIDQVSIHHNAITGYDIGQQAEVGFAVQIMEGFAAIQATNCTVDTNTMDVGRVKVTGPSTSSRASNIAVTNNTATSSGTSIVSHVNGWVNSGNTNIGSLPASGDIA